MSGQMVVNGKTVRYTRFSSIANATSWIHRAKSEAIVLGECDEDCNGEIMVTTLANAERCDRAGYTVIYW